MLGGPGPRDWSPAEVTAPVRRWPPAATIRRKPMNGYATGSAVLGLATLAVGTVPLLFGLSVQGGFLVSTAGISAILLGVHALRLRRTGCATADHRAVLGIAAGALATVLMAGQVALASGWLTIDPGTGPSAGAPSVSDAAPELAARDGEQPVAAIPDQPATPTTGLELAQYVGTLAFTLKETQLGTTTWPDSLGLGPAGSVFRLNDPSTALVQLPVGTILSYEPSWDRLGYSMTLSLDGDPSVRAVFDTATGTVAVPGD